MKKTETITVHPNAIVARYHNTRISLFDDQEDGGCILYLTKCHQKKIDPVAYNEVVKGCVSTVSISLTPQAINALERLILEARLRNSEEYKHA